MDIDTLRHAVDDAFDAAGVPGWDDPHPDRSPRDEEYSRVTDPARYRIVAARVRAWEAAVVGAGLARSIEGDAELQLRPRDGALALHVEFSAIDGVPRTGVVVSAGDPPVPLVRVPDCGCDACDSGSDGLLDELDEHVAAVVSGEFLHVTLPNGYAMSTGPDSCSAGFRGDGGHVDMHAVVDAARAGTSPYPVVRGDAWF